MDLFANYVEFAKFCQLNKVIHNKTDRMDSTKMENSQWLAGIKRFFCRPFFSDPRTLLGLWLILGVVSALIKIYKCNNLLIFKYVFWHAWNQTSLYAQYPSEFFDSNHYGPFFSIIIASFYCIEKEKDITAACFIMIGTFVKLYGIVGLAFFFSKHKVKFVAALIGWAVLFFVLPMAITSPEYIIDQYKEWHVSLAGRNMENMFSNMQNQSLLGRCADGVCLHSDEHVAIRSFPCFHPQELRAALRLEGIALRADMV